MSGQRPDDDVGAGVPEDEMLMQRQMFLASNHAQTLLSC
jgi:hypothetical protein